MFLKMWLASSLLDIQCHNLALIKDIHVHHMISSTVLNTDVHSIHGLVGIPRPTPLKWEQK